MALHSPDMLLFDSGPTLRELVPDLDEKFKKLDDIRASEDLLDYLDDIERSSIPKKSLLSRAVGYIGLLRARTESV